MSNQRRCIVCLKEHNEEYDRYFCSEKCSKRWEKVQSWLINQTFNSDDGAICPLCEHEHDAGDFTELYDENIDEFECDNCGKKFKVSPSLSWSWETTPMEEDYPELEEDEIKKEKENKL
ncbi:MAG: hypothetical protein M0R38_10070 [Bacteroidia bacterium]|nr:hypothetical protein [Bacteroidia bacterium]